MISNNSVSAISVLAGKLNERGIRVIPIPGTPIAEAINGCYNPVMHEKDFFSDDKDYWGLVWEVTNILKKPDDCGYSEFTQRMADITRVLGEASKGHISFARNVVNPQILELAEKTQQVMNDQKITIGCAISVNQTDWSEVWNNPTIEALVADYKYAAMDASVQIPRVHDLITSEMLHEYMLTGSDNFDKDVTAFIQDKGVDTLLDMYRNWFAKPASENINTDGVNDVNWLVGSTPYERDASLYVFLITRGLMKNIQKSIDIPLDQYESEMTDVLLQAGRAVNKQLENRQFAIKNNLMIMSYPYKGDICNMEYPERAQIQVNGDLYNEWLEKGGTPEILFGACITDRETSMDALLTGGPGYISNWASYSATLRLGQSGNVYNNARRSVHIAATDMLMALPDEQLGGKARADLLQVLNKEMNTFSNEDVKNPYNFIRRLVCTVLYPYSNAYAILLSIGNILVENPDLTERDAATLTLIDILSKFVADCLEVQF